MKLHLTLVLFTLIGISTFAQVNLEKTLPDAVYVTNLEDVGNVYFGVNYTTNECLIYGDDLSLWKTITIAPPANSTLYDVAYLSTKLFNSDDQVELLAVFTEYKVTSDTTGYLIYTTKIINEAGVSFLTLPGAGYSTVYNLSDTESKLLCFVYDFSVNPYTVETRIYGVPGKLSNVPEQTGMFLGNAFPNPASTWVNIPLSTDFQQTTSRLTLLDVSGKVIRQETIPPYQPNFILDSQSLSKGTYFYFVETNNRKSVVKKIVIN